jgi:hypothetical protein
MFRKAILATAFASVANVSVAMPSLGEIVRLMGGVAAIADICDKDVSSDFTDLVALFGKEINDAYTDEELALILALSMYAIETEVMQANEKGVSTEDYCLFAIKELHAASGIQVFLER